MGIQGLLPLLKSIMEPIHIKELKGCCIAVDTYSWLHKGALSCSMQLCKGLPTTKHIEYCMHRVNLLRHYGVEPILVFDGGFLPMKVEQENKRARSRKENLERAVEHELNGNSTAAYECYQKAVDISPSIAHELIQVLKREGVSYVVAPYEADAQMTFLAVSKQVQAVITEDSDLIPFGCPRIIYKMDKYGQGLEFQISKLKQNKDLNFTGFTGTMLLEMCIFSGCDYLQSLPGMGLKRAHALVTKFKSYDKVIKHLRYSTVCVPSQYEESFRKALLTFQHQRVYDPTTEDIVHLSSIPEGLDGDLDFLGPLLPQEISQGIAKGELDPFTQKPFQGESIIPPINKKFELRTLTPESGRRKLELPAQKNVLTKYFCFASLEAKRKFRAPRMSPTGASPVENTSAGLKDCCNTGTASSNANCSIQMGFDLENIGINTISNNVEDAVEVLEVMDSPSSQDAADNGSPQQRILLQQSGHSMNEPRNSTLPVCECEPLLKECDFKKVSSAVQNKMSIDNKKVTVRSRYFQHKVAKNDQVNNKETLFLNDEAGNNTLETSFKTRKGKESTIAWSSDLQQRLENETEQDIIPKTQVIERDETVGIYEDIGRQGTLENKSIDGITMKRKAPIIDTDDEENTRHKHMHSDHFLHDNGCSALDIDKTSGGIKAEEKFGSNISHLSRYSDISEKSMERFVSVLSAFRYTSSGSRASGLRAPLRDIRNTCENRSLADPDFSQFAYKPNKRNAGLTSRRRLVQKTSSQDV